jgi:hypothetical protein
MISRLTWLCALLTLAFASSVPLPSHAAAPQPPSTELYSALKWRNIGPFHGGRISGVSGAIGQPGVFYAATPQGGIWKTTSAGVTWLPIADQLNIDSFGAVQVAPSDPNIVCRQRRSARRQQRRRHVQVDGRRQDVDAHRPRRHHEDP